MRVFGYSRVSTSEQADSGSSLATQRQQIAGYAMIKGWSVDEHFVEEGVSGSTPLADRPEGKRLLSMLGEGDVIVSAKLDRAFRSAADALTVLEELKAQSVGLHLIDLGGDVTGNGISKMVFTILAAVAEGERDRIRERIRDARRHLASQGVFGGGRRPFGSDVVMDGKIRRIVPNEAEMAVIERMKAMRRDGATYRAIGAVTGHQPMSVRRILERVKRSDAMKLPTCSDSISREIEARAINLKARGGRPVALRRRISGVWCSEWSFKENTECGFAGCRFTPRTRASPVSVLTR